MRSYIKVWQQLTEVAQGTDQGFLWTQEQDPEKKAVLRAVVRCDHADMIVALNYFSNLGRLLQVDFPGAPILHGFLLPFTSGLLSIDDYARRPKN